eukprot:2586982-Rhodomonas_salina.1
MWREGLTWCGVWGGPAWRASTVGKKALDCVVACLDVVWVTYREDLTWCLGLCVGRAWRAPTGASMLAD